MHFFLNKLHAAAFHLVMMAMLGFSSLLFAQTTGTSTIEWDDAHQRIDGFGACSAWMSSITNTQADLLFGTNGNGIGLSLLRARIAPGGTSWDTSIMQQAQARGAKVWSAPWSPQASFKTNNSEVYGGFVLPSKYSAYATQLANYVLNLKNTYGVNLYALSINNEPTARPPFESCQWTAQQLHDFVPILYNALVAKGVGSTKIMLPEHQTWDVTLAHKTMSDPVTAAMVGIIASHDYAGAGPGPLESYGKPLWQTERANTGSINNTSISIQLHEHMVFSNANAWHSWWLNQSGDDGGLLKDGLPTKQFYALGNFSRFIRPNYYRIGSPTTGAALVSAYKDWRSSKFAIVAVNQSATDITQTFTLSGANPVSTVVPWVTSPSLDLASQAAITVTGQTFTYTIPSLGVVTFAGQTQIIPGPYVTPVAAQTTYRNTPSSPISFTVGDASVAVGNLTHSATSTNSGLLPPGAFAFSGTGADRVLVITSTAGQTGTATVSLVVGNGSATTTTKFLFTVLPPPPTLPPVTAVAAGSVNSSTTWGGILPVDHEANLWRSGANTLSLASSPAEFHGGTLVLQSGGRFSPGVPGAGLTLNNVIMDGGTISMANNNGLILNLSGKNLTLNNGTFKTGTANSMNIVIENAYLSGSGTIHVTGTNTNGSQVQFQTSNYTDGFNGIFSIHDFGLLDLPPISISEASFGLNLSGTGKYNNEFNVALTSLVINGTNIPYGVYSYASFSPEQQAFLSKTSGIISVVPPSNSPPTISTVADLRTSEDALINPIPFTVNDLESGATPLSVTVSSNNQIVIPDANLLLTGSGSSRSLSINPVQNQNGTAAITLIVSDGFSQTETSFLLTVDPVNDAPTLSQPATQNLATSTTTGAIPINLSDVDSDIAALTLSVTSDNPSLVPTAAMVVGGTGSARTLTITPFSGRQGSATISVKVSDESLSTMASFGLNVTSATAVVATPAAGAGINDPITWAQAIPITGDDRNWKTGPRSLSLALSPASATQTFAGQILSITAGGQFSPEIAGANLTLNNLILDGGTIYMGNNLGLSINLSGKCFTLNSGNLKAGGATGRDIRIKNGLLSGQGTIAITAQAATTAQVDFQSTVFTKGFTGNFDVKSNGILNLSEVTRDKASFGIILSGNGKYVNDSNVAVKSLIIEGIALPAGSYGYANFNSSQRPYFTTDSLGTITVVSPLETWRINTFGGIDNIAEAADDADPDGDGETNLIEYAFAQNPMGQTRIMTPLARNGTTLELDYTRSLAAATGGIIYTVQWSDELGTWNSNGVTEQIIGTAGDFQKVRATIHEGVQNRFIRLRVMAP
jgi:O-glycosyl hydrolase